MSIPSRPGPTTVGLVCPSQGNSWLGGLNYLHHLALCLALTPGAPRTRDVWWGAAPPSEDPFAPLREHLGPPARLGLPTSPWGRARRHLRRLLSGVSRGTLADIFQAAGIDVLFPCAPCERPGIPVVGWITDLQYLHLPQYYTADQREGFHAFYRDILLTSTLVMVSSEAVYADLRGAFPDLASRARVLRPCSVPTPEWWSADPVSVAEGLGLPRRYFVVSNQVCAHKNHRTVFRALAGIAHSEPPIEVVCTGLRSDYRDPRFFDQLLGEVRTLGLGTRVHFTGVLPRAQHAALLRGAVALLQPSEFEGWGFALSDALAVGTPAIASDIPVHHEHPPSGLRLLPVHDEQAWARAMSEAWEAGGARHEASGPPAAAHAERHRLARELQGLFAEAVTLGARC